ncbi:MAG: hypothetical protein GC131_09275 [Alphaproteobacteria bacterium]|nr:hypothetical protein [Alphaproteobacteria bacterium]
MKTPSIKPISAINRLLGRGLTPNGRRGFYTGLAGAGGIYAVFSLAAATVGLPFGISAGAAIASSIVALAVAGAATSVFCRIRGKGQDKMDNRRAAFGFGLMLGAMAGFYAVLAVDSLIHYAHGALAPKPVPGG